MTSGMDYSTKSDADVLSMLDGARRRLAENSQNESARRVIDAAEAEAIRRGLLNARTKTRIQKWSAGDVEDLLAPFIDLTRSVPCNTRVEKNGITHAGGLKIKGEMAIDSYTAIKAKHVDAVLVAYAKDRGDVPYFLLLERLSPEAADRTQRGRFEVSTVVDEALPLWRELARAAGAPG